MPKNVSNIFVVDITQCYENILIQGEHNSSDVITFFINNVYSQYYEQHNKSKHLLWIKIYLNKINNVPSNTIGWASTQPKYGDWISLSKERFIKLNIWLMNNCFVTLKYRVWKQVFGIPIGFSCSLLRCNIYFLFYECWFIGRMAKLGWKDLMDKFRYASIYMDNIC